MISLTPIKKIKIIMIQFKIQNKFNSINFNSHLTESKNKKFSSIYFNSQLTDQKST